ncbi:hypothetical protein KKC94_03505 [Patescibacteria group bacterium]|nr:hypothetical protein [Patescibacteria group bacterium]
MKTIDESLFDAPLPGLNRQNATPEPVKRVKTPLQKQANFVTNQNDQAFDAPDPLNIKLSQGKNPDELRNETKKQLNDILEPLNIELVCPDIFDTPTPQINKNTSPVAPIRVAEPEPKPELTKLNVDIFDTPTPQIRVKSNAPKEAAKINIPPTPTLIPTPIPTPTPTPKTTPKPKKSGGFFGRLGRFVQDVTDGISNSMDKLANQGRKMAKIGLVAALSVAPGSSENQTNADLSQPNYDTEQASQEKIMILTNMTQSPATKPSSTPDRPLRASDIHKWPGNPLAEEYAKQLKEKYESQSDLRLPDLSKMEIPEIVIDAKVHQGKGIIQILEEASPELHSILSNNPQLREIIYYQIFTKSRAIDPSADVNLLLPGWKISVEDGRMILWTVQRTHQTRLDIPLLPRKKA